MQILQQEKKIQEQEKSILELNTIIVDQNAKIAEQEGRLNEINQKLTEYENQLTTLFVALTNRKETWGCNSKITTVSNTPSCSSKASGIDNLNQSTYPLSRKRKYSDTYGVDNDNVTLIRLNPPRKAKLRIDYSL